MVKHISERTEIRGFSVDLSSKTDLRSMSVSKGVAQGVLVEGALGELVQAGFEDGVVLEVIGSSGTLRIDLKENELAKAGKVREHGAS